MGEHIIVAGYINGPKAAQGLYVFEILFPASNTAAKLSTLLLYKRIFGATRNRYFYVSVYVLCTLWSLLFVVGTCCTIFQCGAHFSYAWETDHTHGCIDLSEMVFALTVISVILNFFTLILPIPFVYRLQLEGKTKFGVLFVFILGGGDMIISVIRAVETAGTDLVNLDFTWLQSRMVMLGFSEPCLGIICTCIILLRPIFLRFSGVVSRVFSGIGSTRLGRTFTISTNSESNGKETSEMSKRGYFVVPIFLQTRAKWDSVKSSLKSSMKSGLSGATMFSRRDNLDDLDDWERKNGKGGNKQMDVVTHPWEMDTFDKLKAKEKEMEMQETDFGVRSGKTSMTYETIETVQRLQILKLDKPLPPMPGDDYSVHDDEEATRKSFG